MDRRLFLALATGLLAAPGRARAMPTAPPLRRLTLIHAHTGESFDGPYRDALGPIGLAMEELSHFLRDHHSGHSIAIDVGVVDFLAVVMDAVGATRATILSAYRTPETNAMLARTTFGVADNSQHLYGRALDVHLGARRDDAMKASRGMERGGVGWYPHSGFFHIDTGPVRNRDLEGRGLGSLLVNGRRHRFSEKEEASARIGRPLPEFERTGRILPEMAHSGRVLPEVARSGRLLSEVSRGRRPL